MSEPVLIVEKLTKKFGARQVLDGVSFAVAAGEAFGFAGPNGAGKTTAIKIIMGYIKPDAGQVAILGHPPGSAKSLAQLGFLPERPYFYEHLTGRELLNFFGELAGLPRARLKERIPAVLQQVNMAGAADLALNKYSKGMVQRIGLAQAILGEPRLLILDEPLGGLDPAGRKDLVDLFLDLKRQGVAIFLSTHILPDVERLCDQLAVLHRGRIVSSGPLAAILRPVDERFVLSLTEVSGPSLERLRRIDGQLTERGGLISLTVLKEQLGDALAVVEPGQARLVSLTPWRKSLEQFVVEELEK